MTGAKAVYGERVRGVLAEPQLAKAFFRKPEHVVWTFGRKVSDPAPPELLLHGRSGRCLEELLEATGENVMSRYGIHWIKRTTGTAMGKTESPIKAEIVFSDEEKLRTGRLPQLRKEGFVVGDESIHEVIAGCRYVDDLVLFSKLLCVD